MGDLDHLWMEKLDQEKSLFDEILALSERQLLLFGDINREEDVLIAEFDWLIDQRQVLIDQLDAMRDDLHEATFNDPVKVKLFEERNAEIGLIMEKIADNDKKILYLAGEVLNGLGDQLRGARQNRQAYNAYAGDPPQVGRGWFIDRKK